MTRSILWFVLLGASWSGACAHVAVNNAPTYQGPDTILNVSYDVSRELFAKVNAAFIAAWQQDGGRKVEIRQAHGGTTAEARAILGGLEADVVTFNQVVDVQLLQDEGGLIQGAWRERLPHGSAPFYSLPVFLVRKGNPGNIRDWGDLVRADTKLVLPDPRTSGNARYSYLAAYAHGLAHHDNDQAKTMAFVQALFGNVAAMPPGGRAATEAFVGQGIGDVLITFECEAREVMRAHVDQAFEIVMPRQSILADFPVCIVDRNVDRHGTRPLAEAYLRFLFGEQGQEIAAGFFLRVRDAAVSSRHQASFPPVDLVTVEQQFGGWERVQAEHFASGRILEQVLGKR